jgi:phosphatidylinositol-3-phosphatase
MRIGVVAALATVVMAASGADAAAPPKVPKLDRVVVIVFENKSFSDVIDTAAAPTFNRLARRYGLLTRYYALARPSLPNYLALVSGSTQGVTQSCTDCVFDARNLADTIEASGRTWKTYAEGLPHRGFQGAESGQYVKRHNPFLYFRSVVSRPSRLRRIVPLDEFSVDLARRRLPDFSLVVPDLCNGMHDCAVAQGDAWLDTFLAPLLRNPQLADGAVFVTFDEPAGGHIVAASRIVTLVLGPLVRLGARSQTRITHYGLLRTIEDAWQLPRLGRSARATPITGIWRDNLR